MDAKQAKEILNQFKKQITQRKVFEALNIAIEALEWEEADGKTGQGKKGKKTS